MFSDMREFRLVVLLLFQLIAPALLAQQKLKTENVVIMIMDGPRYSETWGDSTHKLIPHMANDMAPQGIISTNFWNNGPTYTCSGHTAICTGVYQKVRNDGTELPKAPTIFQYWLKESGNKKQRAYIIASKDKLSVLSDCKDRKWRGQYRPAQDCGENGLNSGYRRDEVTFQRSLQILKEKKPRLTLINFRQPDSWGHAGNWERFLSSTKKTDEYIYKVFQYIQTDEFYRGKTTVFVTNDHGRHLDGKKDGFISHGDKCEGCKHINFFAYGPDFKSNQVIDVERELIDIPVTVAAMMGFCIEKTKGDVMTELFNRPDLLKGGLE